jgi:LmbE family N-acetylglucosaminyl deacetylase
VAEPYPAVPSGQRVVVLSPHLDDGVLSLGAAMAAWARAGAHVELLTVLGCDPASPAPAGGWDQRAGFATEGESALARREEDRRAAEVLEVTPVWLPFGSVDYERHGDEAAVRDAVAQAVEGAEAALVPGYPLSHPDHAWLVRTLGTGRLGCHRLGLYAEQPYTRRDAGGPCVPGWLDEALGGPLAFGAVRTGVRDRLAKWRAIRCYRSQLPLLAMHRSLRRGPHVLTAATEYVAWTSN